MGGILLLDVSPEMATFLRGYTSLGTPTSLTEMANPDHLPTRLEQEPSGVDAVVLGERLKDPLRLARRAAAVDKNVVMVVLCAGERHHQLTQSLLFTPGLGREVLCLPAAERETVALELEKAIARTRQRRMYWEVVAKGNARLAESAAKHQQAETALQENQELLRESQELLREITENIRAVFWLTDAGKNHVLYVSPAYEDIWGRTCESLYASPQSWLDAIHPEDRPRIVEALHAAQRLGVYDQEYRVLKPDGSIRWIRDKAFPVKAPSGIVYRIAGIAEDITERKQAEQSLRESEHRYQSVVNEVRDVIFQADADGLWTFLSPAWTDITGFTLAESIGANSLTFVYPEDRQQHQKLFQPESSHENDSALHEVRCLTKDGGVRWIEVHARPTLSANGRIIGTLGTLRDITQQKSLEAQFRQAQKMEAIGQLAGGVAHDFNNLLTVITGYGEMLLQSLESASPQRKMIEEILKASDRAVGLTQRLLAFSRRQVLQPNVLALNAIVTNIGPMLRRLIGEDIDLVIVSDQYQNLIHADPGQLDQVIINLAINARDAMPQGGRLTLEIGAVELDEDAARALALPRSGPHVTLRVHDTGCGMSPEVRDRIFDPFFTTKAMGKGTGLGLSIVHGIVTQSGGAIAVDSEVGRGSTFTIYLPKIGTDAQVRDQTPPPATTPRGSDTILLVEDEVLLRAMIVPLLEDSGYTVLAVGNPEEAMRVSEEQSVPIHLLVTDVVMPGMNGRVLAERLTAERPTIKVLYMSGYMEDTVIRHGVEQRQTAFLQKPFTPDELLRKIRDILDATTEPRG